MPFDTKFNISNGRFEQLSGDTINLSGTTAIYGDFTITSGSTFNICKGTVAQDSILVSDGSGSMSLQAPKYITGTTNGITKTGFDIVLGGILDQNTVISGATQNLSFGVMDSKLGDFCVNASNLSITGNSVSVLSSSGSSLGIVDNNVCTTYSALSTGLTIIDDVFSRGVVYYADYSTSGSTNPRWIPDLGYVTGLTSGNASGENVTKEITQTLHGFSVNDFIGWSGGTYSKAIADGTYDGEFIGIVSEVSDSNTFKVTQSGYVSGFTGLVTNTTYFLSDITAGQITGTSPTTNGHVNKAVLIAISTTEGWVLPYPGVIVTTAQTSVNYEAITIACSDETTNLASGTGIVEFIMPFAMTLDNVIASVTTPSSGATIIVDINEDGSTILSSKLVIDAEEKTSLTSSSPVVISDNLLAQYSTITIDLDQVGLNIKGTGLKVIFIGERL